MGRHFADDMGIVTNAGSTGITGQPIGFGSRAGGEIGDEERVQAGGRVIGYFFEANAPGTGTSVLHLDGADGSPSNTLTSSHSNPLGCTDWDSRFGQNYWYPVPSQVPTIPSQSEALPVVEYNRRGTASSCHEKRVLSPGSFVLSWLSPEFPKADLTPKPCFLFDCQLC